MYFCMESNSILRRMSGATAAEVVNRQTSVDLARDARVQQQLAELQAISVEDWSGTVLSIEDISAGGNYSLFNDRKRGEDFLIQQKRTQLVERANALLGGTAILPQKGSFLEAATALTDEELPAYVAGVHRWFEQAREIVVEYEALPKGE